MSCSTGTPLKTPARGSVTVAVLPQVAPQVRWFSGVVANDFSPSPATPLSDFCQVMMMSGPQRMSSQSTSRTHVMCYSMVPLAQQQHHHPAV